MIREISDDDVRTAMVSRDDGELILARHLASVVEDLLARIPGDEESETIDGVSSRMALVVNRLLTSLRDWSVESSWFNGDELHDIASSLSEARIQVSNMEGPRELRAVQPRIVGDSVAVLADPVVPVDRCDLLVNARDEQQMGRQIELEFESADRVDLICAFLKVSGVAMIETSIQRLIERAGAMRLLTTTYCEATEKAALERLAKIGVDIKVSYDVRTSRLHAKSWLFHRKSGYSTIYVGSSNVSRSALVDGIEWNVRLAEAAVPDVVAKFRKTFDSYWQSADFRSFDPQEFDAAIAHQLRARTKKGTTAPQVFEIRPWAFQEKILDDLMRERYVHRRWKNLVIAATGAGKTVISAFDYDRLRVRLRAECPAMRLLFVAHRKEILEQSRSTFRGVLRDSEFGELFVDGETPSRGTHVFASIQSLDSRGYDAIDRRFFDVIIIDEFHHATALTYRRLIDHFEPRVLLGLTATPERMDGADVREYFDGRIAAEYRLFEALEHRQLSPFHYYAVPDATDLSKIGWRSGRYDTANLERYYLQHRGRTALVLRELDRHIGPAVAEMRSLAFCVSVAHAEFMAKEFSAAGVRAAAVHGQVAPSVRESLIRDLREKRLQVITCVDVFNEGVDIPEVDVLLFLRPTESATVFTQQLGRGLRRSDGKEHTTVLDFVGRAHRSFRFEAKLRALLADSKKSTILDAVERHFPHTPPGCFVSLEGDAHTMILKSIRNSIENNQKARIDALKELGPETKFADFLRATQLSVEQVYAKSTWTDLRRRAGFDTSEARDFEDSFRKSFLRLATVNDRERIAAIADLAGGPMIEADHPERRRRLLAMVGLCLAPEAIRKVGTTADLLRSMIANSGSLAGEMREFAEILGERTAFVTPCSQLDARIPLALHAEYSLREIMAAFGRSTLETPKPTPQGGVQFVKEHATYLFFVTIQKDAKDYHPHTMYRDYAISRDLFHWESEASTRIASTRGQDFIHHAERELTILFFIRQCRLSPYGGRMPYVFAGPARYVAHEGERPMGMTWKLGFPLPAEIWSETRVAAV